jgi:hypothetical protein
MYKSLRISKDLSDGLPIRNSLKQGDALIALLFNFALANAIRRVRITKDGLKFNGTHQFLVYSDDVNILGGSIHTVQENAEALLVASKEIGLEVQADKTKYMVMSRDWNARRSHNINFDSRSLESVEEFKYSGATLMNKYSIQEESDSRLK